MPFRLRLVPLATLLAIGLVAGSIAYAATACSLPPAPGPLGYLIPPACLQAQSKECPPCGLPEMIQIAVNLSRILLATLGSVTILIVIYGGFVWLTSAGSAERIQKGKKIFEGALIGFVVVVASWVIINFVVAALTGQSPAAPVQLFKGNDQKPAF